MPPCASSVLRSSTGEFYCYECAMLNSVAEVGTSIRGIVDKAGKIDIF